MKKKHTAHIKYVVKSVPLSIINIPRALDPFFSLVACLRLTFSVVCKSISFGCNFILFVLTNQLIADELLS